MERKNNENILSVYSYSFKIKIKRDGHKEMGKKLVSKLDVMSSGDMYPYVSKTFQHY